MLHCLGTRGLADRGNFRFLVSCISFPASLVSLAPLKRPVVVPLQWYTQNEITFLQTLHEPFKKILKAVLCRQNLALRRLSWSFEWVLCKSVRIWYTCVCKPCFVYCVWLCIYLVIPKRFLLKFFLLNRLVLNNVRNALEFLDFQALLTFRAVHCSDIL